MTIPIYARKNETNGKYFFVEPLLDFHFRNLLCIDLHTAHRRDSLLNRALSEL